MIVLAVPLHTAPYLLMSMELYYKYKIGETLIQLGIEKTKQGNKAANNLANVTKILVRYRVLNSAWAGFLRLLLLLLPFAVVVAILVSTMDIMPNNKNNDSLREHHNCQVVLPLHLVCKYIMCNH